MVFFRVVQTLQAHDLAAKLKDRGELGIDLAY
jgi:hypothetical protein